MGLELIKISEEDLEIIMRWRMLPEVTKYMYTDPELTLPLQKKWFDSLRDNPCVKYWIIIMDSVKIGLLNLCDIDLKNRRCQWAYYIGDTGFRGRGIATLLECNIYDYVFNTLNLNKLCCEVLASNEKVINIHQKFGSEVEGIFKQHILKNGCYFDIVAMAITKNKWETIKSKYNYEKINIE